MVDDEQNARDGAHDDPDARRATTSSRPPTERRGSRS
jgi:hypothetical protein